MKLRTIAFIILAALTALAQSTPPGGGKVAAIVGPRGATLPAACADGQLYQKTSGGSEGTYSCVLGSWVAAGAGSVGTAGTGIAIVGSTIAIDSTTTPQKNAAGTWTGKQIFELMAMTPSTAPGTPTSGQFYIDSTANMLATYNGSAWTFYGTNPGTTKGDLFYCSATATPCVLTRLASGAAGRVLTANGAGEAPSWDVPTGGDVTADSTTTLTNKTLSAEGTGNVLTVPFKIWLEAASCQGSSPFLNWDVLTATSPTANCITGTNTQKGVADFADGATVYAMQRSIALPDDWTGAIDAKIKWLSATTTGSVVWQIATICTADAETDDPAFNTASTVTDAAKGTTLQLNDATITGITATGCAAGELLHLKVLRDPAHASDDHAATARLIGVEVTLRRAM